jgi:sigma-B regulation protein RsbU (phosphoserine phosphatase)
MEKVLVVDDNEDNRRLLSVILEKAGYAIVHARDGHEALRMAFESEPDLILLDIMMPGMDGYEVCRVVKQDERTAHLPVIFISALDDAKDKIRGLEIGGDDYITKPFNKGEVLARVRTHLNIRRLSRELVRANRDLTEKQRRLDDDLQAAAGIQKMLLPQNLPDMEDVEFGWKFLPCDTIGGDIFNVHRLDEDHLAFYMLDVSGHGVPSALVTVSVSQALQPHGDGIVRQKTDQPPFFRITAPREVLKALDGEYPIERFGKFFTIVYLCLDRRKGRFVYSAAGHPPPVMLHRDGPLDILEKGGPIIGLGGVGNPFEEEERGLKAGDKLIFYTDGVVEYEDGQGAFYGSERFFNLLERVKGEPIGAILDHVFDDLMDFGGDTKLHDDVTLLGFEFKGLKPRAS